MPDPITSSEELDAELERLTRDGGTPADFEAAVQALALRLEKPIGHRAALRIARVGWTSFNGLADVPADTLPEFLGRPWVELPQARRRDDADGPRQEQLADEPLHLYVGYLAEELFVHLGLGEEDLPTPVGQAIVGYVSVLAVPELRKLVGWERSLDAHALGMLTAERALRHLGEVGMTAEQEEDCFRWLHLATYAELGPEHLAEMRARRQVRRDHARQPAGAVAVMTCEVDLEDALWFQERISTGPTAAWSRDQLRAMLDDRAAEANEPQGWVVRREGFGHLGRLELSAEAAVEGPDHGCFVHGHLMRWMVEEEVPFRPHLLGVTAGYTASIHRRLVTWPAENGTEPKPVLAHLHAMKFVRQGGTVLLADELVLLAWLMDQRGFAVRLAPYLASREQLMATTPSD